MPPAARRPAKPVYRLPETSGSLYLLRPQMAKSCKHGQDLRKFCYTAHRFFQPICKPMMNKPNLWLALPLAALLAACGGTAETSVVAGASDAAVSAPAAAVQQLTSADGAVVWPVGEGFGDVPAEAAKLLEGIDPQELALKQYHEAADITVYITQAGAPKQPAEAYFAKLAEAVKAAPGLEAVVVDAPAADYLAYRFSRSENGSSLNESCKVLYSAGGIYNACAVSPGADLAELEAVVAAAALKAQ